MNFFFQNQCFFLSEVNDLDNIYYRWMKSEHLAVGVA